MPASRISNLAASGRLSSSATQNQNDIATSVWCSDNSPWLSGMLLATIIPTLPFISLWAEMLRPWVSAWTAHQSPILLPEGVAVHRTHVIGQHPILFATSSWKTSVVPYDMPTFSVTPALPSTGGSVAVQVVRGAIRDQELLSCAWGATSLTQTW